MDYESMTKDELLNYKKGLLETLGSLEITGDEMMELPMYAEYMCVDGYIYNKYGK